MAEKLEDMTSPPIIFYSYAHEDELLREQLERHLRLLSRQGLISEWHDRKILPGEKWAQEIDSYLEAASIILLLISSDFLASDYCYSVEMQHALERQKEDKVRVIPIILRPVDWHDAPFANLLCLPQDGKPVTEWDNQDAAFRDITKGIRKALTQKYNPTVRSSLYHQNYRRFHLQQIFSQRTHLAKPFSYTLIGLALISALITWHLLWYGAFFFSPLSTVSQNKSTSIPLEIPFVTSQSEYWAMHQPFQAVSLILLMSTNVSPCKV